MAKTDILNSIFNAADDAIIVTDDKLNVLEFNVGAEIIFKYKKEEIIGQNIERLIPTRFRPLHSSKVKKFADGERLSIPTSEIGKIFGLRSDGEEFPALASVSKYQSPEKTLYAILMRDIGEKVRRDEAIERSENMLKIASEDSNLYIYEIDYQKNTIYYSQHCQIIFGDEIPNVKNILDRIRGRIHSEDLGDFVQKWQKHLKEGTPFIADTRLISGNYKIIWASVFAKSFHDEKGNITRIIGSIRDITEKAIIRENSTRLANRLELAVDSLGLTVFDRDYQRNELHIVRNTDNLIDDKMSADGFLSSFLSKIHDDDRDKFIDMLDEAVINKTDISVEFRMYNLENKLVWAKLDAKQFYDPYGAVVRTVGALRDITEEKNVKVTIATHAERLRIATENAGLTIYQIDYNTEKVTFLQSMNEYTTGIDNLENFRKFSWSRVHPDDRQIVEDKWQNCSEHGKIFDAEYRQVTGDNIEWIHATGEFVADNKGKKTIFIGTRKNITKKKKQEAELLSAKQDAEKANLAKNRFMSAMSHDMRTPLNGIMGILQIFPRENLTQQQLDLLKTCLNSSEFLSARINDIIDFAQIERGEINFNNKEFELSNLIRNVVNIFLLDASQKGIEFEINLDAAAGTYYGDPVRIQQILDNIISNSIKFTTFGKIYISANYNDLLEIRIRDEGMGLDSEVASQIYCAKYAYDDGLGESVGGSGTGLAICRALTKSMGGRIFAESEPNKGMMVTLQLPLERITSTNANANIVKHENELINNSSAVEISDININFDDEYSSEVKILVVEDNPTNQAVIKYMLEQIDIYPDIVGDGKQAIEKWDTNNYDLILMDIKMPIMDGLTATKIIRATEKENGRNKTPIIAVTANALQEQIKEYMDNGFDDVVTKPIIINNLFDAMNKVLEN